MAQTYEFCSERADEAADLAAKATLDNVRDRELRSEKTWRGLAEQARKTIVEREKAEAIRAERRAADAPVPERSVG
ncbi:MAG: hypothetical protein NBV68_03005 [Erythrobacter sp.]|uniref:hypothetical protein n=1 Tax=Erythrobacter sp. TaxID=1042 RepID=UPI0025CEEB34|nr:hypothetical protein [Erythrobacter sp.]MCL9998327.1 hypothetical protein [Erythrobacter sp.]